MKCRAQINDESRGDSTRPRVGKLFFKGPNIEYLRLWGSRGLCLNYLTLLLLQENNPERYVNTSVWLGSSKTSCTKARSWQDLALGQVYQALS